MGSYSDVVEISSEEEDANNNNNNSRMKTNFNWSGDPPNWWDDLIIMDEISTPPATAPEKTVDPKSVSLSDDDHNYDANGDGANDDDDDDCQILDSDPDKSVVAVSADKDDESDEIEIVGAKGEVACRDFPHPRHLCANFPFNSTSHDKYCQMCHCYVCDSPAPCTFWGSVVRSDSHCHATEKIPIWKNLRNSKKASSLQETSPQNVMSRVMPPWQPMLHKSYAPNPNQVSRPTSLRIPSRRLINIGPITTGSMPSHRSGPYSVRSHQLARSNSMHASVNMFKRTAQPYYPSLNAHQTQPGAILNGTHSSSNESLLRSTNAVQNCVMQRSQSQSGAFVQVSTSVNSPLLPQTQMNIQGTLADVASKSWKDILDSVASELGVPDYSVNASGVPQTNSTVLPAPSGALDSMQIGTLDSMQTGNLPMNAQLVHSTTEQNVANLNASSMSENLHANFQDMFESDVSPSLYGYEDNWIDRCEF